MTKNRIIHFVRPAPAMALALAVALAGCTTAEQSQPVAPAPTGKTDIAIKAFKELCLQTAPSFAAGISGAKRYGIKQLLDLGGDQSGMTDDKSMSVQIKPNRECAITSPNRADPTLHRQFVSVIAEFADKVPADSKANQPFVAMVKGKRFIFQHDRNGGEAYVMLSLEK
ncbi:hypothetical protein [Rhizobium sp.]|uniref:hypothetical protein n=1 Tax=Rhizobium sp. TaxID=391 RepID=UPI002EE70E45